MKKETQNVILIPTDFSEVCDNAINHGFVLAKAMQYRVWLLHVINKDTHKYLEEQKLEEINIEEMLQDIADKYHKKYNVQVDIYVSTGNLFEMIDIVNNKLRAKLIILSTHGKIGFQKIA